ncbi:MAG: SusF/SusE family outer membrane protein [Tannerella sp.]|jgi:hypothetical protein|nr:SusF/SusE family outer membrane protein [Tannerella sp.]
MKRINNKWIILPVALLFVFASCEDDRSSNPVLHNPVKFVLNTPAYAIGAVYDLEKASHIELTCSQPDYGFTAATVYSVQVSLNGDFTAEGNSVVLPTTYNTAKMQVDASELAVAQTTLALAGGKAESDFPLVSRLDIRLKATLTNGAGEIYSNPVTLEQVRTVFALSPVVLPSTMYVAGSGIGEWDWANSIEMIPTWNNNGTFWHILYCEAGAEMKFNIEKAWDGVEFGSSATLIDNANAGLGGDGNLQVTHAGWYLAVVRSTVEGREIKYSISFEKPDVYLIGGTGYNGEWSVLEQNLFTVPDGRDGYFVSPPFSSTNEVRICTVIEGEDWWHSEFIVLQDGVISYRGTGDDQERYTQSAGKRVYLNFMTEKGYYE